ncbi:glycosyltransferase [soil metagenome]
MERRHGALACATDPRRWDMTAISVVVPAHDEEGLIRSTLRSLHDATRGSIDIVVVANGCQDATAARAREVDGVRVIEISEASKIRALNVGNGAVSVSPVAFVDADVTVRGDDLLELARRMQRDAGIHVASPRMRVQSSTSWAVRQYYRVWALTDYRSAGHIGSGVYMLGAEGRARIGEFPDIVADDTFVQRMFAPDERLTPDDLWFEVRAPGSLRALVHRNSRIAAGNRQLSILFPELAPPSASAGARALLGRVWRRPSMWAAFVIYTAVYSAAHRRAGALARQSDGITWHRDETTRTVPA